MYAILDENKKVIPASLSVWSDFFEDIKNRIVKKDVTKGGIKVSTVFLGIDHSFGGGPPLWFETMIFGGEHDEYQDRCENWDQALEMHKKALLMVGDF